MFVVCNSPCWPLFPADDFNIKVIGGAIGGGALLLILILIIVLAIQRCRNKNKENECKSNK